MIPDDAVLAAIAAYIAAHGYAPTLRDVGEACGCSHMGAKRACVRLRAAGRLRFEVAAARSFVVVTPAEVLQT